MKPKVTLIRAISMEFVLRRFKSLIIPIGLISLISLAIAIDLTAMNSWWLLLLAPLIIILTIGLVLSMFAKSFIDMARPNMTIHQNELVKKFVDKLERIANHLQTPMFLIVLRILRDSIHPHGTSFICETTKDGASLHTDFFELVKKFNE